MHRIHAGVAIAVSAAVVVGLSACSAGSESGSKTITFAYQQVAPSTLQTKVFTAAKKEFEKENPGATLKLDPINAQEDDFKSKVQLLQQNTSTAPDIVFEDGSRIESSAEAKYISPITDDVKGWKDWSQFPASAKAGGQDVSGTQYMVPLTTDTRGIWYDKDVFAKAGLPTDWQPKTWDDLLDAARKIHAAEPGVTPSVLYGSKAMQEASAIQGVEMLLSGTPGGLGSSMYDSKSKKWVTGSAGLRDSLSFYNTMRTENLGPSQSEWLNPNLGNDIYNTMFPQGQIGFVIDGNWCYSTWEPTGTTPWPDWDQHVGWAAMPTQNGQGAKFTSMSGSNGLTISAKSGNPSLAFKAIKVIANQKNMLAYDMAVGVLPPRTDVAQSSQYTSSNPTATFFTGLEQYTHYRPGPPEYPQVSLVLQTATEASLTGSRTPAQAAAAYDQGVTKLVGASGVEKSK